MSHTLAIITVVYRNYTILQDFLDSFARQTDQDYYILIVDLSEDTQPITHDVAHCSVLTAENLGYAHGVNVGLKEALKCNNCQFVVMNSDTYVKEDFVVMTKKSVDKHPSSLIGGKIYYAPGFEYDIARYSPADKGKVIWYAGGTTDWNHVHTHHRGVDEVDNHLFEKIEKTDFITGCLMAFDKSVVEKVGFWDESYFLYYEDADYCERAKQNNISLYYDPSIVIWHKNAQSTGGSGSQLHENYQNKNRLKFGLRYAPWRTKLHLVKNSLLK